MAFGLLSLSLAAVGTYAVVGARAMRSILYDVALVANWRPARRAAAVDPIEALRAESPAGPGRRPRAAAS